MSIGLPIVMLVILGVFGAVFFVITKKQEKGLDDKNTTNTKKDDKKEKSHEMRKEDIFDFMEFEEISDNMIIQNNGTKYTMMVQCKGINYDLMSDVEQLAVEEGFITFLNTLTSPIQLYVQAQNLDLKGTIKVYKDHIDKIREEFEEVNQEYNRINEAFDSTKEQIKNIEKERNKTLNVYEYASDIVNYVERISLNKSLLQRTFFVLVSYNSSEINSLDRFSKEEVRNICYNELVTRAQSIINGLAGCSVAGRILNSNEIADVLYTAYNRDDKGLMSVKEALDSGFYRLYSTSEDIFLKKQKKLEEEIDNEAKIKALETLKETIKEGEYISPRIRQLDIEERISKKASEVVRRENVPIDIKEKANEKLIQEFRKTKKDILDKAAVEYKDLTETLGVDVGLGSDEPANNAANNNKNNLSKEQENQNYDSSKSNEYELNNKVDNVTENINISDKKDDNFGNVSSDFNDKVNNQTTQSNQVDETNISKQEDKPNTDNIDINLAQDTTIQSDDRPSDVNIEKQEEKPIVQKVKIDNTNFEYNNDQVNTNRENLNFDDRLGSSEDDSIV